MISGDLIRLKNSVEDCQRIARSVKRELERLNLEERGNFDSFVSEVSPNLRAFLEEEHKP